jgi:hypothetical protein
MKPRLLVTWALALGGILSSDACTAPNEQTLVIAAVFPPAPGSTGGTCGVGGSEIASGLLDVTLAQGFHSGYLLFPSALNKQISNASFNRGIETNQIIIDTARIDITLFGGATLSSDCTSFDENVYAYVRPAEEVSVPVQLIPSACVAKLNAPDGSSAQVSMQFIGTSNNNTVKSNTMKFTVNLCKGCLQNNVGACCAAAANVGLCNPGQDAPIDCCTNGAGATVCPAAMVAGSACGTTTDAGAP